MIVIPMAGLSSRFFKAGYKKPKYMLEANGASLFDHAINSFKMYFSDEYFLFIIRDVYQAPEFIKQRVEALGIKKFDIVLLEQETRGQAETVYLGLQKIKRNKNSSITIFNIDTFRPNFIYPDLKLLGDGYLEVFKGDGDNWSFVKPRSIYTTEVIETAEKCAISDLCCTGLYHFSQQQYFEDAYEFYLNQPEEIWEKGELYVAPLYNYLINKSLIIHYQRIDRNDVIFCGTPDEYDDFNKLTS